MSTELCEDLSSSTIEDLIRLQLANRAWKKELRIKNRSLVDDRLAKQIGAEQYAAGRKATKEESAECSRRERVLDEEMATRHSPLRSGNRPTHSGSD